MGHTQSKWKRGRGGGGGRQARGEKRESENENGEAETQRKTATQRELESFIFQELHFIFIQTGKKYMYIRETDRKQTLIVQELCESRGGRPGLSVLTSLLVSVDVKQY